MPEAVPVPPPAPARRLSDDLAVLISHFADRTVTLRDLIEVLQQRAYPFLLFLFSLPFCFPVAIPGLSTPFGLVIALIGFRLALGQRPWLPRRLLDFSLPASFLPKLLRATRRLVGWLEHFLRPRWTFLVETPLLHRLHGAMIGVAGLLLLLPLPIPFSNLVPALAILFLAGALLEKDGAFSVAGSVAFIAALGFFGGLLFGGAAAADFFHGRFGGGND